MKERRFAPSAGTPDTDSHEPSEELVALYREHMPSYLEDMKSALAQGDHEAIRFQCHKMTSAVKIMGFDNISLLLETIQRDKPEGEELNGLCERVEKLVHHTLMLLGK